MARRSRSNSSQYSDVPQRLATSSSCCSAVSWRYVSRFQDSQSRRQEGPVENKRRRPLRIRGREQRGHCRALRVAEQGGPFRADGIHDRANVVHPRLQIRYAVHPIGKPGSALVEDDQTAERRKSTVEVLQRRLFPAVLDIRDEARREDEVKGPITKNLIGKRGGATPGVTRLRSHAAIIGPNPGSLQGGLLRGHS